MASSAQRGVRLQRKSDPTLARRRDSSEAPPIVHDVLRSPGQSLDPAARSFMEPRFGYDFSKVRVHADSQAAKSAEEVNAQAYTVGSNIVFGANQGAAGNLSHQRLLAHELAHVVQQGGRQAGGSLQVAPANDSAEGVADRAADQVLSGGRESTRFAPGQRGSPTTLQRRPVTTDLSSVAQYEWTGTEQRKTNTRLNQAYVSLSYEPTNGDFNCSFHLRWRFPASWAEPRRAGYIEDFVRVVKAAWEGKFPLKKYENNAATPTTARVLLNFDHIRATDMGNDTEYVNWLMNDKDQAHNMRWTMNVHDSFQYRDKVDAPGVHLDPGSNTPQNVDTSAFKDRTYTNQGSQVQPPPYQHYFDKGITPSQGSAPGGTYNQTASAHEFGHMIGLADEYVLSADDYHDLSKAKGQPAAEAELRKRTKASARIENVGGQVTADAYRPFADFLHTLTAEDWRVG